MSLNSETVAQTSMPDNAAKCTVAAGCFWGVEHAFRKQFKDKGLLDAKVGYCGGDTKNPSYRAVCSGRTGPKNTLKHLIIETLHIPLTYLSSDAEALQVIYDPSVLTYATLIEFFYKMHDPTTKNRQGGDAGTQYRSAIYWHDAEQEKVANEITAKVGKQWWRASPVTTEVAPAGEWFDAEGYHQKYLDKTPGGYECPSQ
ncbi:Peptide-methionine (S)-S-oxide reductase [Varicellaria rhodocarpa]|nr:Peptide-methionine (S)-S-oxide reductase [Varicellaria rhodocarpa]